MVVRRRRRAAKLCTVFAAAVSAAGSPLAGATKTWNGSGDTLFGNGANWTPSGPVATDDLVFSDVGIATPTIDLEGNTYPASGTFNTLSFTNTTGGYTLGDATVGGTLSFTSITHNATSTGTNTINAKLTVTNGVTVTAGTLALSNSTNVITGTSTVASGATLDVLAPASTSIGNVTLNGGKLVIRGGATIVPALQQYVYRGIFGTNRLNPISTGTGALAQTPTAGSPTDFSGVMTFDDATLNAIAGQNDNYTIVWKGDVTVNTAGAFSLGTSSDDGSVIYVDLNKDGVFDPATELVVSNNFDQGPTARIGGGTIPAGKYPIAIGYYENGGGAFMEAKVAFGATNTAYGSQTVIDVSNPIPELTFNYTVFTPADLSGSAIALTASSTIDVQSTAGTIGNITFSPATTLTLTSVANSIVTMGTLSGTAAGTVSNAVEASAGALSGFTSFTKAGTGILTLRSDAAAGFNAPITVSAGILRAAATSALGTAVGNTTVENNAQLSLRADNIAEPVIINGNGPTGNGALESGVASRTFSGPITLGSNAFIVSSDGGFTLTMTGGVNVASFQARFGGNGNHTINTVGITGTGGIRKTEGGTLTINAPSSFSGAVQMDGGTLTIGAPLTANSAINQTAGTINANAAVNPAGPLTVSGGNTLPGASVYNANAVGSLPNTATVTGVLRVANANVGGGTVNVRPNSHMQFNGGAGTATFAGTAVNLDGSTLTSFSGVADMSNAVVTGTPRTAIFSNTFTGKLYDQISPGSIDTDPVAFAAANTATNNADITTSSNPNRLRFDSDAAVGNFFGNATTAAGGGNNQWTATFEGTFTARTTGSHYFGVEVNDDNSSIYVDTNQDNVIQANERVTLQGCCNTNNGGTVNLTAGQTYKFLIGNRDTGGGGSMSLQFAEPGQLGRLFAAPGLLAGGGTMQVDPASDMRVKSIAQVTDVTIAGTAAAAPGTLRLMGTATASNATNVNVNGFARMDVAAANHTMTVQNLNVAVNSTLTKIGPGTVAVTGSNTITLNGSNLQVNGGVLDLSAATVTSTAAGAARVSFTLNDRVYLRGPAQADLAPISNLIAIAPTYSRFVTFPMTYDTARVGVAGNDGTNGNSGQYSTNTFVPINGNHNNIETLTTGTIVVPASLAGEFTFGSRSDDGSVVYIDLNNNGSFADAGELIVDNNFFQGYTNRTGNVTLAAGTYNIALGFYQGGCCDNNGVEFRFGPGPGLAFNDAAMAVIDPSVALGGGSVQVDNGGILAVSSITGPTVVTVGGTGGGTLRISAKGAPTASTLPNITVPTGGGTLDVLTNNDVSLPSATLTGTLTKTGAGRLAVTGTLSGAGGISVTGGTLGGTGSIAGPLSVSGPVGSGGTVAPGNSVGTLSSGNFSVASAGGTLGIELDPTNSGGLGTADNLNVTGTVTLTGGNLAVSLLSFPSVGQQFQIITNDGADAVTGTFTTANGVPIAGNSFAVSGNTFGINYASGTGNDVVLTVTGIPEPTSVALLALAGVGLLARRRRRTVV